MSTLPSHIRQKAEKIRLMIFDVDGVLTDRRIYLCDQGHEYKSFNTHDGFGIKMLLENHIEVAIITARQSPIVIKRMQELGVKHILQGQHNKLTALESLRKQLNFTLEEISYLGDDVADLPVMRKVGLGIAVADAVDFVKQHADWQTQKMGGLGAAREVCELILNAQNRLESFYQQYL